VGTKIWIRHVIVPNITDSKEHIKKLGDLIKDIKNIEKIELVPYHTLGVNKYEKMKINYKLKNTESMDREKCKELENYLKAYLKCIT
jgi:pyruvate formate lyase activating enzyme